MARVIKQKAIICDIDGVLLDTAHIFDRIEKAGLQGRDKWEFFNRHANDYDVEIDSRVVETLETLSQDYKIIFLTSRSAEIYKQTRAKIATAIGLYAQTVFDYILIMRKDGDPRDSVEVKAEWLKEIQQEFDVIFAIDDESENCEMFARNNILTLKVQKREDKQA